MQYALVNGTKTEPQKGLTGVCLDCGSTVIAKCGSVKIHHWSHKNLVSCDSWAENETEWHRNWKNAFPMETREISFKDEILNEYHRADVHTINGITLEFQNSPISLEELKSRDAFYKQLIWIVNAKKFKGEITFKSIPSPTSTEMSEWEFSNGNAVMFFKRPQEQNLNPYSLHQVFSLQSSEMKHIKNSINYFHFTWKRKHIAWFSSNSHVFLDFGDEVLYWLRKRVQTSYDYWYLQRVSKKYFIKKYSSTETEQK